MEYCYGKWASLDLQMQPICFNYWLCHKFVPQAVGRQRGASEGSNAHTVTPAPSTYASL